MTSPNDETQPINRLNSPTVETALVALRTVSQPTGRHRARRAPRRLSVVPSRAALGAVWRVVWPPVVGALVGAVIVVAGFVTTLFLLVGIWHF